MQNNLNIRGEPIQSVYSEFKLGKYIVNRRYQRKLVWTLREKQKFIDSILNQYPVPLFLGVIYEDPSKGKCFEILDGMQRLEAITSFIEGDFPVNAKYFDLSIVSETNRLVAEGKVIQKEPRLEFDLCKTLLNYPLPISSSSATSMESIDETFRRINTGGVRLSWHEVRQAGTVTNFSQLVREFAAHIRGDVSHSNIIVLNKMKEISLTNDKLDYGIKIRNTFWCKNHIITPPNVLASRDEELLAHIILRILLKSQSQTSAIFLDKAYNKDSDIYRMADETIVKYGKDNFYKQLVFVYEELSKVIQKLPTEYHSYLYRNKPVKVADSYQVLFITFFELLLNKNQAIINYESLAKLMKNIATDAMGGLNPNTKWKEKDRSKMIQAVSGIISSQFQAREGMNPTAQTWVDNLENILTQSKTESVCYDFKIGLHSLMGDEKFNRGLISKIVKTLTAMTNSHAGENFVILGVADSKEDAEKHQEKFQEKFRTHGDFFITGIGAEATKYHKDIDAYQQKLQQVIDQEPIDDATKRLILRNIVFFKYYEKDIVIFKVLRDKKPMKYDKKIYIRKLANTDPSPVDDEFTFFEEFIEQTKRYPYN